MVRCHAKAKYDAANDLYTRTVTQIEKKHYPVEREGLGRAKSDTSL